MESQEKKLGFTEFAETWNGRLAMLGFVIGVATELLTGHGILSQIGLIIPLTSIPGRIGLLATLFLSLTNLFINHMVISRK